MENEKEWMAEAIIKAFGFNALAYADISTRGVDTKVLAYGYRALTSATVQCSQGSHCNIVCKSNACKNTPVYVDKLSTLSVDPAGCDPLSDAYKVSKKDPSLPGKQEGIHCPIIIRAGKQDAYGHVVTDGELESKLAAFQEMRLATDEWSQIMEEEEMDEEAFKDYLALRHADYEDLELETDDLDESDLDYLFGVSGEAAVVQGVKVFGDNALIYSNMVTGLVVFMVSFVAMYCYFSRKYREFGYKAIPEEV
eukprot:72617_1